MKKLFSYSLLIPLLLSVCASSGAQESRVIIQYKTPVSVGMQADLNTRGATIHRVLSKRNMVAVTLPSAEVDQLRSQSNVLLIEEDLKRYPTAQATPWGIQDVQAEQVWDNNLDGILDPGVATGAGMKVCVIDSGLLDSHEDFAGLNIEGMNFVSLANPQNWNIDGCAHGTHVAGTVAAAFNDTGVVGVAPQVDLAVARVFNNACNFTFVSTLIDAADYCQEAGADVINMSLSGPTFSAAEAAVFGDLHENQNMVVVAASGNDALVGNPVVYPASYPAVISVGAYDESQTIADFSNHNEFVELSGPGVNVLSVSSLATPTSEVTVDSSLYNSAYIQDSEIASASGTLVDGGLCDSVGSWSGNIVLCERGSISFSDKVLNANAGGATGALIYNNVPGLGTSFTMGGVQTFIPSASISQADGQSLVAAQLGNNATIDVIAGVIGESYSFNNGTSMATPHVAGAAALLWSSSAATGKTAQEIRKILADTAEDLGVPGKDDFFGYGGVRVKDAIESLQSAPIKLVLTQIVGPTGKPAVKLNWSGASGATVQAYKTFNSTTKTFNTANDGEQTDFRVRQGHSFSYQVCDTAAQLVCSDEVKITIQ